MAIVGSRAASGAGRARARSLAAEIAGRGFEVLSGGAFGIDAAAHEGALDAGAPTFAVLGCGVDVAYPDRHRGLFARMIACGGGLLGEHPAGTPPRARHFPARNRIVAALADAVVVVEAAARSGALITARLARRMGRPVFACPGSAGTDAWLASGEASPLTTAAALEDCLASGALPARPLGFAARPLPPGPLGPLVLALRERPDGPEGLSRRLGLPLPVILSVLTEAELQGWVRRSAGTLFEGSHGH